MSGFAQACLVTLGVMIVLGIGRWVGIMEAESYVQPSPDVLILDVGETGGYEMRPTSSVQFSEGSVVVRLEPYKFLNPDLIILDNLGAEVELSEIRVTHGFVGGDKKTVIFKPVRGVCDE